MDVPVGAARGYLSDFSSTLFQVTRLRVTLRHRSSGFAKTGRPSSHFMASPPSSSDSRRQEQRRGRIAAGLAFVGTVVLIVVSALLWPNFEGHGGADRRVASAVAEEIVMRHRQGLMPELEVVEWGEIAARMPDLEFTVRRPERLDGRDYRLLGGRYGTLGGRRVAELHLESPARARLTLFQMPWNDAVAEFPPHEVIHDGVRVELWREGDVFFALAGAP